MRATLHAFIGRYVTQRLTRVEREGVVVVNPKKLAIIASALMLLAGVGVATAFAGHQGSKATAGATTSTCADDQQGENEQGDAEETSAAADVEDAAAEVAQEAARSQADDESGDDQPGEQGDEQGENDDCD